jgi:hypothetical protein
MAIRAALLPKPLDPQTVMRLAGLADRIVEMHNAGRDPAALIATYNAATGQQTGVSDFTAAWRGEGTETFVERTLRAPPRRRPDVTDDDLWEVIAHVVGPCIEEGRMSELAYWLAFLDCHLPHPAISDLIFHRNDLDTPAKILAEAKTSNTILL